MAALFLASCAHALRKAVALGEAPGHDWTKAEIISRLVPHVFSKNSAAPKKKQSAPVVTARTRAEKRAKVEKDEEDAKKKKKKSPPTKKQKVRSCVRCRWFHWAFLKRMLLLLLLLPRSRRWPWRRRERRLRTRPSANRAWFVSRQT